MDIYTAGYKNHSFYAFRDMVEELDALVVDVRFSPYTALPFWGKDILQKNLARRYIHIKAFGNRNYQGGEIKIDDFEKGFSTFAEAMIGYKRCILLCSCEDAGLCHRSVVADMIHDLEEGSTVTHL